DASQNGDVFDRLVRRTVSVGKKPGNGANKFDRQVADPQIGADELERSHGEKRCERVGNHMATPQGEPGRRTDHALLRDPSVDESLAQSCRYRPNRRAIFRSHHDDALVGERQLLELLFVVHAYLTVNVSDTSFAPASPRSSFKSCWISASVKLQNHRSARASIEGSPLPRRVRAITMLGLPLRKGIRPSDASSAAKSWPSTVAAAPPNAANFASSGSRGMRSSVRRLA